MSDTENHPNGAALRAIRAVLSAPLPERLLIEGKTIRVSAEPLPPLEWPADGLPGIRPDVDGPLPVPLRVRCEWDGGSAILKLSTGWWPRTGSYGGLLGLSVRIEATGQEVVWTTVALSVSRVDANGVAPVRAQFSLFTRKGEQSESMLARWGYPLKKLVERSGLKRVSPWVIVPFSVKVPSGEVAPEPAEALRNLLHLAVLKLPFQARGAEGSYTGAPPFEMPGPAALSSYEVIDDTAVSAGGKRLAIQPLPGGVREYKNTFDAILARLAGKAHTIPDLNSLLREEYEVTGETAAKGYASLFVNSGLAALEGDRIEPLPAGTTYLQRREALTCSRPSTRDSRACSTCS